VTFLARNSQGWYLEEEFQSLVEEVGIILDQGGYERRVGYAGSMGAFGLTTYSGKLRVTKALIFNPISTLNRDAASFETRFLRASYNGLWSSAFADAVVGSRLISELTIVYDPYFELDRLHAKRYAAINVKEIKVRGVGHKVPEHLKNIGLLKKFFKAFIKSELTVGAFPPVVSHRLKSYEHHNLWMVSKDNKYLTYKRYKKLLLIHQFNNKKKCLFLDYFFKVCFLRFYSKLKYRFKFFLIKITSITR
jgi:hypothetical protein